jgi:hypothetical protein
MIVHKCAQSMPEGKTKLAGIADEMWDRFTIKRHITELNTGLSKVCGGSLAVGAIHYTLTVFHVTNVESHQHL